VVHAHFYSDAFRLETIVDVVAITIGCGWTVSSLVIIGLAIPLVRRRIGPNAFYGVRFAESFRSEDAWYAINRYGGRRLIMWAIPLLFVGLVSFFLPLKGHPDLCILMGFAPLVFVLLPAWESWRFARRYTSPH
jgi:hypothetical protein